MKSELLALSHQVATAARGAISSRSAVDIAARLGKVLTAPRVWPLSVILASWELSRSERNRPELARLLRAAGVPNMWPQLDLFSVQLAPIFSALEPSKTSTDAAPLRFLDAVQAIGLPMLRSVVESGQFRSAARIIARDLPEVEKPKTPSQTLPRPAPSESSELLAMSYLIYVGWDEQSAAKFLAGKR